jgi:hypothetical protein
MTSYFQDQDAYKADLKAENERLQVDLAAEIEVSKRYYSEIRRQKAEIDRLEDLIFSLKAELRAYAPTDPSE